MTFSQVLATVDVHQRVKGAAVEIVFHFPNTGQTVNLPLSSMAVLDQVRIKAGRLLRSLVDTHAPRRGPEACLENLRTLYRHGVLLVQDLAGHHRERVLELQDAFRLARPTYMTDDWSDPLLEPPIIEVHSRSAMVPVELLPLFLVSRPPIDVHVLARVFLGFAAVVRRVLPPPVLGDNVLKDDPHLPVQLFRHWDLAGSEQSELFSRFAGRICVDGPWPTTEDPDTVKAMMISALRDGSPLRERPHAENHEVQIHHFACHCDTSGDLADEHWIKVSTKAGGARSVTLEELRIGFNETFFDQGARHRGVVYLNACGSSTMSPLRAGSFPEALLGYGHRAFIGTETAVPDDVAGTFTTHLYEQILLGDSLGKAILRARRNLLRHEHNPLGLMYVAYGNLDLTVKTPKDRITEDRYDS